MVPQEGLEPPHRCQYQILSLARLPVPPLGLQGIEWRTITTLTLPSTTLSQSLLRPGSHSPPSLAALVRHQHCNHRAISPTSTRPVDIRYR